MPRPARFFASLDGADASLMIYDQIGASYFSDGVTAKGISEALDGFRAKGARDLHVYVNSPGGDVFEGNAIFNVLERWEGRKVIHIDGLAASMASVIAMVGDEIRISANGMVMVHAPWGVAVGNADEMRERAVLLDKLAVNIRDTYVRRTHGIPASVDKLMADETWMDAEQAKSLGFVDAIEGSDDEECDEDEAFASAPMLDKFLKTPDQARRLLARAAVRRSTKECGMGPQPTPAIAQANEEQQMPEKNEAPAVTAPAVTLTAEQFSALVNRPAPAAVASTGTVADVMSAAVSQTAPIVAKYTTPKALVGRERRNDESTANPKTIRGLRMARFACSVVLAKEIGCPVADAAEMLGFQGTGEIIARGAMQEGDATTGGTFSPTELQQGFIDMLDEMPGSIRALIPAGNIVRSAQAAIQFPTITSGVAGGWVGENPALGNPETPGTGSKTLVAKKQRVEVVISRDLLRGASNVDAIVLQKMLTRSMQLDELAIVEGTGTSYMPRGLETIVPSGSSAAMTAAPDYEKARSDFIYLLKKLATNKVPREAGRAFIVPEQAKWGLYDFMNPAGTVYPFEESMESGRILGQPFATSALIGTDKVYCFAPGEAILFERLGMTVERDTTYHTAAGLAVSASSSDQVVIRLWRQMDFDLMHDLAVSAKTGITWGA